MKHIAAWVPPVRFLLFNYAAFRDAITTIATPPASASRLRWPEWDGLFLVGRDLNAREINDLLARRVGDALEDQAGHTQDNEKRFRASCLTSFCTSCVKVRCS